MAVRRAAPAIRLANRSSAESGTPAFGYFGAGAKKACGPPAFSPIAIISLRRGDFLFDLDRRDIE
jgi:hypothetical protein